ncbi:hypothetical protein QVD17_27115 [Tagetes erecta]|uniref:Uncharacterized protein n=1 Tax=Tagetes erecta TaxID=13708 RepID=A0AAD8NQR5_TARER|nr:hypothetical protein QVD17_27115 [Tagetes erecta]
MCCGKICMTLTCLIAIIIAIGMLFGFGVFTKAFHKVNHELHYSYSPPSPAPAPAGIASGRPFITFVAPPPI